MNGENVDSEQVCNHYDKLIYRYIDKHKIFQILFIAQRKSLLPKKNVFKTIVFSLLIRCYQFTEDKSNQSIYLNLFFF